MRTIDGDGKVVPLVVGQSLAERQCASVGAVDELVVLEAQEEFVAGIVVGGGTLTVADERSLSFVVGLEPQHQRVVLFGTAQHLRVV